MDDITCGEGREHDFYESEAGTARCWSCGDEISVGRGDEHEITSTAA